MSDHSTCDSHACGSDQHGHTCTSLLAPCTQIFANSIAMECKGNFIWECGFRISWHVGDPQIMSCGCTAPAGAGWRCVLAQPLFDTVSSLVPTPPISFSTFPTLAQPRLAILVGVSTLAPPLCRNEPPSATPIVSCKENLRAPGRKVGRQGAMPGREGTQLCGLLRSHLPLSHPQASRGCPSRRLRGPLGACGAGRAAIFKPPLGGCQLLPRPAQAPGLGAVGTWRAPGLGCWRHE